MAVEAVQSVARARADELPGAGREHPFGPDWDVYKVRGRVFMLLTEVTGVPIVIVKADPESAVSLRQMYAEITPGYHMNKRHWITITGGTSLDPALIVELVTESYRLVVQNLPRLQRPVDPATFGQA